VIRLLKPVYKITRTQTYTEDQKMKEVSNFKRKIKPTI